MNNEIAYSLSGFVRVVQTDASRFEVQTLKIRGPKVAHGPDAALPTYWSKLCAIYDHAKAVRFLESYV